MNITEIILRARAKASFNNLIPLCEIKTDKDAEAAREKGYGVYTTHLEFADKHPSINPNHIWFAPGFTTTYYWDGQLIIFPISYYINGEFWGPAGVSFEEHIDQTYTAVKNSINKNDYTFTILLSDLMRIEYIELLAKHNIILPYNTFLSIYCSCDSRWHTNSISSSMIDNILQSKSIKERTQTEKRLGSFPDIITIYQSSISNTNTSSSTNHTISWTLDKNIALSHITDAAMNREHLHNIYLHTAHIHKTDVIEYINSQKECLVNPTKIFDVQTDKLYDYQWLQETIPYISDTYEHHRQNNKYRKIHFDMHSRVHGKSHCIRVMLLCLLLAHQYQLNNDETRILIEAALYHDTGRQNDNNDTKHGSRSADKYKSYFEKYQSSYKQTISDTHCQIITLLMTYHCANDTKGYAAINKLSSKYPEIDIERTTLLYNILKDADGLDRLRLHPPDLDINYLRTDEAKKMPYIAQVLINMVNEKTPLVI